MFCVVKDLDPRRQKHFLVSFILLSLQIGCVSAYIQSIGGDSAKVFERIYLADYNLAWQAVLEALKHNRLDVSNRESGFVQTRWMDNTNDKNLIDSFGNADTYLKAQYRFRINVAKGFYNGQNSVRISVQKEQLIQRDVLEGWRPLISDSIDENTLLYRIARIITIKNKIALVEKEKAKKALEKFNSPEESSKATPSFDTSQPLPDSTQDEKITD